MSEFRPLFDGISLAGWLTTGAPSGWVVEDGKILCTVCGGGYLYTELQYENFELKLEFRTDTGVNSGIFFRWSDLNDPVHTGLEIQILDTFGQQPQTKKHSGALYDLVAPSRDVARPAGEWNDLHLTCQGPRIQLNMNGHQALDVDIDCFHEPGVSPDGEPNKFRYAWKDMPRRGHIGLQDHGGRIWFRNLSLSSGGGNRGRRDSGS